MKGKKKEVDTATFTTELSKAEAAKSTPEGVADVTHYNGTLDWIEPFATAKPQPRDIDPQPGMFRLKFARLVIVSAGFGKIARSDRDASVLDKLKEGVAPGQGRGACALALTRAAR